MVAVLALQSGVARADTPQALVLGDSVYPGLPSYAGLPGATPTESIEQYEAEQDGYNVTVVDGATWDSMTAAQFASYQVLIIGDPDCAPYDGIGYQFQAAVTNESTWEPVVMASGGNKVLIGTDPTFHWYGGSGPNANILEENGIAYAGAVAGATGAYVDLSCTYSSVSPGTAVPLLDGLSTFGPGSFTVGGAPCDGPVSIIAATGPTAGLPDSDLANWSCSVHEFFTTFPADYTPLALATGTDEGVPVTYTGTDVDTGASVSGSPYIMISGSGISISSDLSVTPPTQTLSAGTSGSVTGTLVDSTTSAPIASASVTFDVTSGPDAGQTFTGSTNGSGQLTFTYTNNGTTGTDQILATTVIGGVTEQGTASITWSTAPPPTPTPTPAATTLTTSLSGGGQTGTSINVAPGTAVTDQATLSGTAASTATGSVTYNVYSDNLCTTLVSAGTAEPITTAGTLPASSAVSESTAGTYYWQAVYSGDANNAASTSQCNELETVTAPTPTPTPTITASKPVYHCPAPAGSVGGETVGVFTIGMSQQQARLTLEHFNVTQNKFDNFCLYQGWGIRLGYPTSALLSTVPAADRATYAGHVVLGLTANPFYSLGGVHPGTTIKDAAKLLHLSKVFHVGSNDWYFAVGGAETGVLKVRNGVVQEVGLASLALTKTRAEQRVFINSFDKI
jgi:hypothetical protein